MATGLSVGGDPTPACDASVRGLLASYAGAYTRCPHRAYVRARERCRERQDGSAPVA